MPPLASPAPLIHHPARRVTGLIRQFGYPGLFGLLVAENLFPPIPSEAILPVAGFLADRGEMGFALAVVAATLGSVVGALILYGVARHGGRPVVLRHGRLLHVTERELDRAEAWFARFGDAVVLGARVVPLARSVVSLPAGCLRMGVVRFTVLTAIGSALWNTALVGAGWWLGHEWERVAELVGSASRVVLVAAVVAGVAAVVWLVRRRARLRTNSAA